MKIYDIEVRRIVNDVLDEKGFNILLNPDAFEEAINSVSPLYYEECYLIMQGLKHHLFELLMMNLTTPFFAFVSAVSIYLKLSEDESLFVIRMMNAIIDGINWMIEIANIDEVEKMIFEQGQLDSLKVLATSYFEGLGVQQDYEKAYGLFMECATRGDEEAYYYLGLMNKDGLGTEVNTQQARYYFQLGIDAQENECYYGLGMMELDDGHIDEAIALLDESEDPRSYRVLGDLYRDYFHNADDAYDQYSIGAELYEPYCLYMTAKYEIIHAGSDGDWDAAIKHLTYAYYSLVPEATLALAECFRMGYGVPRDEKRYMKLLAQYDDMIEREASKNETL